MDLRTMIPPTWQRPLRAELAKPYIAELGEYLESEYDTATVYPTKEHIFAALDATPFEDVRTFLIGQDPYHGPGQAHGLCFSVQPGIDIPPSLRNMYKELQTDVGCTPPSHGYLMHWAKQGMLMLNAVLTVRQAEPASHKNRGWETFTDAIIRAVSAREDPVVFVLWGGFAKKKARLIDQDKHRIIESGHPSPLSVRYWRDTRPFSRVDTALADLGKPPFDWQIPELDASAEQ